MRTLLLKTAFNRSQSSFFKGDGNDGKGFMRHNLHASLVSDGRFRYALYLLLRQTSRFIGPQQAAFCNQVCCPKRVLYNAAILRHSRLGINCVCLRRPLTKPSTWTATLTYIQHRAKAQARPSPPISSPALGKTLILDSACLDRFELVPRGNERTGHTLYRQGTISPAFSSHEQKQHKGGSDTQRPSRLILLGSLQDETG